MPQTSVAEPERQTGVSAAATSAAAFGDLSHALRNPIATIQNFCEIILACPPLDPEERRSFVRTIAEEAEHLNRLVADIVDLERARTSPPDDAACALADAVRRATLSLHPLAVEREVEVEFAVSERVERVAVAVARPTAIQRAVSAMVENAIRFSPPRGKVLVELTREPGQGWLIAVSDEGAGVPSGAVPQIFEKFYRAAVPPDGERFKSSGLGLTLARAITEQAGGSLAYEPIGPGARFSMRLPARA